MSTQSQFFFTITIFILTYIMIMLEKYHRTVVALAGGLIVIFAGIISQEKAFRSIDFNTIGLLIGMMVIVGITRQTGVFGYLAIYAAKAAKGNPVKIMLYLSTITAVVSAFLDNVTTVLLIVPVTFAVAEQIKINVVPFLLGEVIASNIGGTATLIGDPPNIMIGSATGLGFIDFLVNLTPVIVVVFVVNMLWLCLLYKKEIMVKSELKQKIMLLDEKKEIQNAVLLRQCLVVISATILGFVIHQYLHLESSTIALGGAVLLLLVTRHEPERALAAVEWPVIFFFAGLFVLVGALDSVGAIEAVAQKSLELTGGTMMTTGLLVLWLSAIASSFIDNIPFVATMIPLIKDLGQLSNITDLNPLWWALSLGACLGGNGTLIGASANVVVAGLAEKRGVNITFMGFTRVAFPLMLVSILICTGYLVLFYFR